MVLDGRGVKADKEISGRFVLMITQLNTRLIDKKCHKFSFLFKIRTEIAENLSNAQQKTQFHHHSVKLGHGSGMRNARTIAQCIEHPPFC
jgi:hypothetical protein